MSSRASFFNKTVFVKTVCRFWPVWGSYLALWALILPLGLNGINWSGSAPAEEAIRYVYASTQGAMVVCFLWGAASAMGPWSFMYSARSASGYACLPVARRSMFISLTLAGAAPIVCANIICALLGMIVTAVNGCAIVVPLLQWAAMTTLGFVFFYGFAVFCAQLTGNIVVMPLVYATLNVAAEIVSQLLDALTYSMLYGVDTLSLNLRPLSPIVELFTSVGSNGYYNGYFYEPVKLHGWTVCAAYAAAGLVFAFAALLLFRSRRMERASDTIAFKWLKPIFKYCMTFGCALVLGQLIYALAVGEAYVTTPLTLALIILCLALAGAAGYLAAAMIEKKSFRVFKSCAKGLAVSVFIIAALALAFECDLFGVEKRVPDAEDVLTVSVNGRDVGGSPELIEQAVSLHRSVLANKSVYEAEPKDGYLQGYITLHYELKNGKAFNRRYPIYGNPNDELTLGDVRRAEKITNDPSVILRYSEFWEDTDDMTFRSAIVETGMTGEEYTASGGSAETIEGGYSEVPPWMDRSLNLSTEEARELYDCVLADAREGKVNRTWMFDDENNLNIRTSTRIQFEAVSAPIPEDEFPRAREERVAGTRDEYGWWDQDSSGNYFLHCFVYVSVCTDSERTLNWLTEHGIPVHTEAEAREYAEQLTVWQESFGK